MVIEKCLLIGGLQIPNGYNSSLPDQDIGLTILPAQALNIGNNKQLKQIW
jgi:hypothetical protein